MANRIILDAGHGGYDNGAVYYGRMEKYDNLDLTLEIGELLTNNGVDVLYTRVDDIYVSPLERAYMANLEGADYFVSIHRNSSPTPNTYSGVQSLVYSMDDPAALLAVNINKELEEVGFTNLGVSVRTDLAVLRRTNMPAVLVEVGFINTDSDNSMFDERFDEIAYAIAAAIMDTLGIDDIDDYIEDDDYNEEEYNQEDMQDGNTPNSRYQNRNMQDGNTPNGRYQNRDMQDGNTPNSRYQNRNMQDGNTPNDRYQNRNMQDGNTPNGSYQNRDMQDGNTTNDSTRNRDMQNRNNENTDLNEDTEIDTEIDTDFRDEQGEQAIYHIQLGLFSDINNANNLIRNLMENGIQADILRQGGVYAVITGNYSDLDEAAQAEDALRQMGYSTLVVRNSR